MTDVDAAVRTMEYYFSKYNLPRDKYLKELMSENDESFVPLAAFNSFPKFQQRISGLNLAQVIEGLQKSPKLEVKVDADVGVMLRPKQLLPSKEPQDVAPPPVATTLSQTVESQLCAQVELYFGDANYPTGSYLLSSVAQLIVM